MNNNIILAALQSQLETIKADAIAHENNVYNPAVEALKAKIAEWFHNNVITGLHDIEISSDRLTVTPNDTTAYGSTITIDYRSSWRDENSYFETSSYRPDLKSNEDNTQSVFYFNAMAAIANKFSSICDKFKSRWMPAYDKLANAKSEKYNEIYKIEREIRQIESQIAEEAKESYYQSGVTCKLSNYKYCDYKWEDSQRNYFIVEKQHDIRLSTGRSRWDYVNINEFEVVSYPKAKHAKVVLKFKSSREDEKFHTREINKAKFAEFIAEVHEWQSRKAAEKTEYAEERFAEETKAVA